MRKRKQGSVMTAPWLWSAWLVGCAVMAWFATGGEMGVPAHPLGFAALGCVLAGLVVLACRGSGADRAAADTEVLGASSPGLRAMLVVALLGLAGVAAQDFLRPGITHGHDVGYHAWGLWAIWRSVLDGDLYPRWIPYLGLGMPLLQFYSPVSYLAAWPAQLLGASPVQALAWLAFLGQAATAGSTFLALRWCRVSRAGGLLGAAALVLAPYHLLDQTFRLALAENMALSILPLFFVAAWKVGRGCRGRAPWVLGITAGLLLVTHILSLIMACAVGIPLLIAGLARGRGAALRTLGLCVFLTAGATAAFWLPILSESDHTAVRRLSRPGRAISPYAVTPMEPLRRHAWERYGVRKKIGEVENPGEAMPLYFGWVLLGLLVLAVFRPGIVDEGAGSPPGDVSGEAAGESRARDGPDPRLLALVGLATLLLAIDPLARLLDGLPLIGRIMYPWRLYGPASVLAALAAGGALDRWAAWRVPATSRGALPRGALLLAVALAALGFDSAPYLGASDRYPDYEGRGLVAFRGGSVLELDLPRNRFIRIENAKMPPSDYDWKIAKSRRVFPEYMSVPLRNAYGKLSRAPSVDTSEGYHASYRVRRGRAEALDPEPYVRFRPKGGRYGGLPDVRWERTPETIRVHLGGNLPAGNLRVTEAWFPGWIARADGADWARALRSKHLLAVAVPAGAQTVEFHYAISRPWGRPTGLAASVVTWLGLFVAWRRRRG